MASHKNGEIEYNIGFNIDNRSLQELKKNLQEISNMTTTQYQQMNPNASKDTAKAMSELVAIKKEAQVVEEALKKAFNPNLGTTNISKFGQELKGVKLDKLYKDFQDLGSIGPTTFRNLTTSLVTTNNHFKESHKLLDQMATSLKNTVKWGISSSVYNTLSGSLQKAWSYAKDLDSALNDIRIVSGQSAKEMEKFAVQANRAAQALGASTLDYAKASLIYFQQGLGTDEANARAEVTVKLANVLGASAKEVSDYMTAIWNNFDNGSKSLEYFADVITALGASTAASSEEIATGLEKFAAVANTVGLSYEYATAALATVVAQTRQSADTVGTAFKTIFARIQDLELGKTLDDGTTLGKYAEALQKVGINIKDQQNQLKDMNTILDEMGKKWNTLSKDQQVALAQNVAGTRQYTQLIALMDNWDSVETNISTASNAVGTLQKQQDIYLESTEAHLTKLSTATERLMDSFIDNKGINSLIDGLTGIVKLLANFTESIGGGGNALLMLGSIGMQVFNTQIANGIGTSIRNLERVKQAANDAQFALNSITNFAESNFEKSDAVVKEVDAMADRLQKNLSAMGQEEINIATQMIQDLKEVLNEKVETAKEVNQAMADLVKLGNLGGISQSESDMLRDPNEREGFAAKILTRAEALQSGSNSIKEELQLFDEDFFEKPIQGIESIIETFEEAYSEAEDVYRSSDFPGKGAEVTRTINNVVDAMKSLVDESKLLTTTFNGILSDEDKQKFKDLQDTLSNKLQKKSSYIDIVGKTGNNKDIRRFSKDVVNIYKELEQKTQTTMSNIQQTASNAFKKAQDSATQSAVTAEEQVDEKINTIKQNFHSMMDAEEKVIDIKKWVNLTSAIGQFATATNSLLNIGNIFNNDNLTAGEKILQITSALATSFAMLGNSIRLVKENYSAIIDSAKKIAVNYLTQKAAVDQLAVSETKEAVANKIANVAKEEQVAADIAATEADAVLSTSNIGLGATFTGLAGAIWIALKPLLPFIAIGGALVGIIALIVKAYNADADAAKKAAEAQKHATEAAEKAKQTYEELNEGFKKYDEGVEAFKKLKVGAEGYQEALDAANQSAMDLIKSNNELAKYATRDGNGLITFGDEKQQAEILNRYKAAAFQSEAAADVARVESNRASLKSDRTNFLRESGMEDLNARAIYNNSKRYSRRRGGSRQTGLYNQEQEPLKLFTDQQLQEVINVINRNNGNFIREDLEKLSDITSEQIDVLEKHQEALLTLAEKTDNLNATNKLLNTEALKNSLQSKEWFNKRSGAEQNAIAAVYGDQFGQVDMNALRKRAEDKWDHDAWFGSGNEDEVHTEYAKRMGYTLVSDNSGDTATYLNNKTGEEITIEDDTQREYLKNHDIQQWMADYDTDYLESVVRTLDKINNSEIKKLGNKYGTDFQTAIYNAIASDDRKINLTDLFTDLSPDEIQELQTTMTPEKWKDTLGLSDEEIKEIFNFSDAELEASGKTAGELFAEKFNQALSEYKWSAKDAVQKALLSDDQYKEFGLAKEDVAGYSEYLMDIANGAEDAADKVNDLSNEMEYNAKSAVTVAKSVMRMNSGVEKLADGQKDWLNVLKKSSIESKEYYDAVDKLRDAIGDLLDLSKDTEKYLDGDFFKKNAELIKKASEGSASAIDKLRKEASKSILISIATDNKLDDTIINNLKTELDNLQKMAEPIVIGTELNIDDLEAGEEKFIEACNRIIKDSKMTAEQATAFFESIGFEPTFETTEQTIHTQKPTTMTVTQDAGSYDQLNKDGSTTHFTKTRTWSWIDGYTPVDETIQVPAMSSDGNAPTIKTITKKGTGISNNYSSKNKGGGSPGKSSKSGGGSDSNKKHVNDEFDRYHQINTQITKVDNSLQKLQSQQKKLTGGNLIQNLTKQWQLLNTQVDNYNKKLDIAYGEQDELYKKLASKGFKFNSDGTIANYMGALKAAEDKYNAKIDQYNSLSSANKKKWDKNETLDKAKEEYDNIKKWADRYDELISNFIPDLKQNIQDSLDKQIELNVQKFNLKLTVTLDMNQATRDWNEWKKRIIDGIDEDDIYGNANARLQDFSTYYSENGLGDIQAQTEQVNSILTELREMDENGWSDIYHDDRAQALEELKEKYTALMESMTDAAQIEKDLYQAILDEMDAVREKFDEQVESYEFLRDIINHDLKVVQMVYGEDAYGAMSKFYDKQQQTYNEQLDFHRQEMDLWYARMEAAEEGSKEWEKARDNWKDAVQKYNQTLEEGLENAKNKFQNALNDIFQNLNNQVTSGKGLDFINEEWELINKNADKYLDTINATYGIRELEKKYLDSINKTDNVKAQQNLKKVMDEQLTNLRQKDKLTQYDLDRANKLYEIEIARMALEDARQNKSQMRLRRDSQGNYSYQYVANQDELQKAQDQVDQLTNSLYNFDKERYNAVLSEVYNIWNEYQQKMAEASLINDPELRAEKQRLIQEQYNQLMMQTEEDYQVSKYNLEESFFNDWTNLNDMSLEDFQNLTDKEKDIIMTELVPTWKNGVSEMAEVFYGENGFAKVTQDSWKAIKDAEKAYDKDLKKLETTAGQTYDSIKDGLDTNISKTKKLIKNNDDLIDTYDKEITKVKSVYDAVGDLIKQYKKAETAAKKAAEEAYKYQNIDAQNQIKEIGDQGKKEPEPEKQPEPTPTPQPEPTPPPVDNTPKTGTGNGIPEVGDDVTVKKSATKFSSKSGGVKMWYKVPGNKFYIKAVSGSEIKIGDPHGPNYTDSGVTGWVNKKDLEGYNTGGYTGSWDNSGRLAMLHQKELILNQTDTKNMLNAVSVMRGLTYSLGSSILAKLANASATNYSNTGEGGGILEQDVHIEATFPNVRNAVEIEQALNNLVNVASQRIMEKR